MYEFKCKKCKLVFTLLTREDPTCPVCDVKEIARVYSFNPLTSFQPHYNVAVGKWVNSDKEFKDALKVASAEQSARTGLDINYVPIDWKDQAAFKPTDDGMDNHYRVHHNIPDIVKAEDSAYLTN